MQSTIANSPLETLPQRAAGFDLLKLLFHAGKCFWMRQMQIKSAKLNNRISSNNFLNLTTLMEVDSSPGTEAHHATAAAACSQIHYLSLPPSHALPPTRDLEVEWCP
jgi:hypothetical protein